MTNRNYIKNKHVKSNHFTINGIEIRIKDKLNNNISARKVVEKLFLMVPKTLLSNIKFIYIGQFPELIDREIQALYKDFSIYVTNIQDSEDDLLDDLIHEVAHSVEEVHGNKIYFDNKIKKEFLQKRKEMWLRLKNQGFEIGLENFLNVDYIEKFDMFLYKEVGYTILSSVTSNLFYSPYAATSIREYFANGFEAFFMKKDVNRISKISPQLFKKISQLLQYEESSINV